MSRLGQGGRIDRARAIDFTFDGRRLSGFAGDTLASALVANDVRLVGRSFKYHRPRGILSAGGEEPNALVTLNDGAWADPNARATTVPLVDGMIARSQNRWPSLAFDVMAVNDRLSPLFVAGFYYKTFMWPAALWERVYEPIIRRAAGLGALSGAPDPRRYARDHAFCDLLVIGAGPAGLIAAQQAARAGLRVLIADEDGEPGGRLLAERRTIDGVDGDDWAAAILAELDACPRVRRLARTSVFGLYDGLTFGAIERLADMPTDRVAQRYWKIVARHTVLATGAIERPLMFAGNDRPGVMLASAIQAYVNRFAAMPGARIAIATTAGSGWAVAADLVATGAAQVTVIDPRDEARTLRGARTIHGTVIEAVGAPLRAIRVRHADGRIETLAVDALGMAGGWNPAIGIASNLGARPRWSDTANAFLLDAPPPGLQLAGSAAGALGLGAALASGVRAADAAIEALGVRVPPAGLPAVDADETDTSAPAPVAGGRGKTFVDFQNDVTDKDVALAVREGFGSVEHLKRYTTLGMATDQGKTSQVNALALLAMHREQAIGTGGTVLSRPPWSPVAIGALAGVYRGRHFRPTRYTPTHRWAAALGASFVDAGQWRRAQWFAGAGETHWLTTVNREVASVRGGVGICDVSTLGKIEIVGGDAATLLDRLYVNGFSALPVGKARYGLMLREDGFVLDDGTTTRFGPDRFFTTTTTANAARVMQHIHFALQHLWPDLDADAVSVTERWATIAVAGPRARQLVARLLPDLDLSDASFPYMAACETAWDGAPARLFRLSFSGELAYELAVPGHRGEDLARALMTHGADLGVTPYGTEALGVMRIEKGHPAGNELNGQTTAHDLGMGRMLSSKKDFIGATLARRAALVAPARPTLVGLKPIDGHSRIPAGAHIVALGAAATAANDQGYVTSAAFSPTLGHPIALALLRHGPQRHGETVTIADPLRGHATDAVVCSPVFVDPEGTRVRG